MFRLIFRNVRMNVQCFQHNLLNLLSAVVHWQNLISPYEMFKLSIVSFRYRYDCFSSSEQLGHRLIAQCLFPGSHRRNIKRFLYSRFKRSNINFIFWWYKQTHTQWVPHAPTKTHQFGDNWQDSENPVIISSACCFKRL